MCTNYTHLNISTASVVIIHLSKKNKMKVLFKKIIQVKVNKSSGVNYAITLQIIFSYVYILTELIQKCSENSKINIIKYE